MNKLHRSSNDKVISGVCGGVAHFFGVSTLLVRILFVLTSSASIWVYVILAFAIEEQPTV